ncbi:MAG: RIO1 family regulatory kinase/ATPase [Nitrososphaerales archaeon]|jgi:RIO kinase 2
MSTTERAARILKSLKDEEWRTLAGLEEAATGHGTADIGRLARMSRLPLERVRFAVGQLEKRQLVSRRGSGYALTKEAVEAMALRDYVKRDLIFALGAVIAKGKESDVYETLTEEGSPLALKFYKLGRTSFTRVRKKRFREGAEMRSWTTANYEAAKREYTALKKLEGLSPVFPRAIAFSRSTVLLEELAGVRLSQRPELEDPEAAARTVLESIRKAFLLAGLVNADLSEYNILTTGAALWLIDWPQAVGASHPNCRELLEHDVTAVVKFFRKAYGVELDEKKALLFATGEEENLE